VENMIIEKLKEEKKKKKKTLMFDFLPPRDDGEVTLSFSYCKVHNVS
jgi:hypothetical protein